MELKKFPQLKSLTFSSTKKQSWSTKIQKSGSGRVRTMTSQLMPEWTITARLGRLSDKEARQLMGFVALLKGAHEPFLWLDPEDNKERGVRLGMIFPGTYQAVMRMGDYVEPVYYIEDVTVYADGTKVDPSMYSVSDGTIRFSGAPPASAAITASYTYYWKVMFAEGGMETENIFYNFNRSKTFKMVTVR